MSSTNYYHCAECDKYYHSDYWWEYHQESKHGKGIDNKEVDYLTSTINTKNSKIKYLEGRLEELVGNAIKTKTYHQSDVDKRVEELEDNN